MLYEFLEERETKGFLLLKDGKIVLEQYFGSHGQDSLWFWFSAGKSLRAVLLGIAQEDGLLDINDPTSDYLGEGWTSLTPEQEAAITVWHQMTMTTGLDEAESFVCTDPECLTYKAPPGTRWYYYNAPYSLLKDVLEAATGQTANTYTQIEVKSKIGMNTGFWLPAGYNTFFISRARDMARFGILAQAQGYWDGEPILADTAYWQQMLNSSQDLNPAYGYLWWLNGQESYIPPGTGLSFPGPTAPAAPQDVVFAAGANGQYISISPSTGLVMVRQGNEPDDNLAGTELHNDIWAKIAQLPCSISSSTEAVAPNIRVFPNPVSDQLFIEVPTIGQFSVSALNSQGQAVPCPLNGDWLDVSSWPSGIYFLKINTAGQAQTKRIIKQ